MPYKYFQIDVTVLQTTHILLEIPSSGIKVPGTYLNRIVYLDIT